MTRRLLVPMRDRRKIRTLLESLPMQSSLGRPVPVPELDGTERRAELRPAKEFGLLEEDTLDLGSESSEEVV